ncbi:hypothetical protein, partial [Parvimonas sp. M20]|uniref:hypothetical protein n=1 Tax=Parvimonas sp. M20 TaxID=3110693 RepID=UPI002B4760CD
LMTAEFRMQPPEPMADFGALPELPDFLTNPGFLASHVDPLTGEDDARPIPSAASAMGLLGAQGPGQVPMGTDPWADSGISRNAPCPCG